MIDPKLIAPSTTTGERSDNYEAMLPLLYAVKDWNLEKWDDAVALFRQFRQTKPVNSDAWIGEIKPFASARVEEYTTYQMAADRHSKAKSTDEKKAAIEMLGQIKGSFEKQASLLIAKGTEEIAKQAQLAKEGKIPEDTYCLVNRKSHKAIDVPYSSHTDGCKLTQYALTKSSNQKWKLTAIGGGAYQIVSVCSGKALNAPESHTGDGVVITQQSVSDAPSERWKIESTDGEYFRIIAASSGKALSVADAGKSNSPVIQTTYTGASEQQWKLQVP